MRLRRGPFDELVKRQLSAIGLDVELRPVPYHVTSTGYLGPLGAPGAAWDIALVLWTPDYLDPYAYLNRMLEDHHQRRRENERGVVLRRGRQPRQHTGNRQTPHRHAVPGRVSGRPEAADREKGRRHVRQPVMRIANVQESDRHKRR